jgi:hypothetical protein
MSKNISEVLNSLSGRELVSLGQVNLKGKNITHDDLKAIGFDCRAMDSVITQMGANNGNLDGNVQTTYLEGVVKVGTGLRTIDEILGITTAGSWDDEEIALKVSQPVGKAELYGDYTNIPFSSYVPSIEKRGICRFEQGFIVTKLEGTIQSKQGFDAMEEKRNSAMISLEIAREEVGYRGFASTSTRIYGLLNDYNLPAYITNLTDWLNPSTTFAEIINDIVVKLFGSIEVRSGSKVKETDPICLTVPTGYRAVLNTKSNPDNQNETVMTRLKTTFPNLRMVSSSEFKGANAGDDAVYMVVEKAMIDDGSTDGGEAIIQVVPTKYMMLGSEQQIKGYVEDATNALAGVFVKRPWLVARGSIPA